MHIAEANDAFRRLSILTSRFLPTLIELVGIIPMDPFLREAVRLKRPVVWEYPQSKSSRSIQQIAESLLMRPSSGPTGRIQLFWERLLAVANETASCDQAQAGSR